MRGYERYRYPTDYDAVGYIARGSKVENEVVHTGVKLNVLCYGLGSSSACGRFCARVGCNRLESFDEEGRSDAAAFESSKAD